MENNNKINLETIYSAVWNNINSTQKNFQVMSNLEYYLNNALTIDNVINNFIKLIEQKIVMIPLKLVNVDVNTNFKQSIIKTESVTKELQNLFNARVDVDYYFNSMTDNFPYYLETDYKIKLNKTCDFALVYFQQNSNEINELLNNIKETFQEYDIKSNTYNNIKECIIKSNANYHKLINSKNKMLTSIERYNNKIIEIDKELSEIEQSILTYNIINDAKDDFASYKENCFKSIFNINKKNNLISDIINTKTKVYYKFNDTPTEIAYSTQSQIIQDYINSLNKYDLNSDVVPSDESSTFDFDIN